MPTIEDVDRVWHSIAVATVKGYLGVSSEVATNLGVQDRFVICMSYDSSDFALTLV